MAGTLHGLRRQMFGSRLLRSAPRCFSLCRPPQYSCRHRRPAKFDLVISRVALVFHGLGSFQVAQTNSSPGSVSGDHIRLFNTIGNIASINTPIAIGCFLKNTGAFNGALILVSAHAVLEMAS